MAAHDRRDDAALVALARAGDRDAFARLVGRHRRALVRACTRALGDDDRAADAAQEAVVAAMLSLGALRDDARFGAWLVGIGLNTSRHLLRERRATGPPPEDAPAEPVDLDGALDAARAAARIRRAIAALPPGQRDAVELFYLAGLTAAETAAHLGVPESAVKTRLHKGRATLRRRLEPVWKEQFAMSEHLPVRVADVRRAGERLAVLLAEIEGQRRLTIWIGEPEAFAIAAALEQVELPRPGSHQLMAALVAATGQRVREVRVSRLVDGVFYADVVLSGGESVDARPSDGIVLALLTGAPLVVEAAVLEQTGGGPDELQAEMDAATDDRRVLVGETRARLARQAEELERLRGS
jgi:RNA polymerase sigma factor (sigma-70 family)